MEYTGISKYFYKKEECSFRFVKKPTLSQQMTIVEDVVTGVINDINGYHPILFDYFLATSIIGNLTDIELPESFITSSEIITESDLLNILKGHISYIEEIADAARKEIEFIKQKEANKSSIDGLVESLTVLVEKYGHMFDGLNVNEVAENIAKIATMSNIPKNEMIANILEFNKKNKSDTESK